MRRSLLAVMLVSVLVVGCKGPKGERGDSGQSGASGQPSNAPEVLEFKGTISGDPTAIAVGPWTSAVIAVYYSDAAAPNDWRQVPSLPAGALGSTSPWYNTDSANGGVFIHTTPTGSNYHVYVIPVASLTAARGLSSRLDY